MGKMNDYLFLRKSLEREAHVLRVPAHRLAELGRSDLGHRLFSGNDW